MKYRLLSFYIGNNKRPMGGHPLTSRQAGSRAGRPQGIEMLELGVAERPAGGWSPKGRIVMTPLAAF
jgi:hypothetical protein